MVKCSKRKDIVMEKVNLILNDKEKKKYDTLSNERDKQDYLKAIQLKRKADKLQAEITKRNRKEDAHNKIVLGGIVINAFGKLNEEQRNKLLSVLNDSEVNKMIRNRIGLPVKEVEKKD